MASFTSHSVPETETIQYREKMVRFKTEMTHFRTDAIYCKKKKSVIRE